MDTLPAEEKVDEAGSRDRWKDRFFALIDYLPVFVTGCCPELKIVLVNRAVCRYLGIKRATLLGRDIREFIPAEDHDQVAEGIRTTATQRKTTVQEYRIRLPSGHIRWTRWINQPFFDSEGRYLGSQGIGRDITAARLANKDSDDTVYGDPLFKNIITILAPREKNQIVAALTLWTLARLDGEEEEDIARDMASLMPDECDPMSCQSVRRLASKLVAATDHDDVVMCLKDLVKADCPDQHEGCGLSTLKASAHAILKRLK